MTTWMPTASAEVYDCRCRFVVHHCDVAWWNHSSSWSHWLDMHFDYCQYRIELWYTILWYGVIEGHMCIYRHILYIYIYVVYIYKGYIYNYMLFMQHVQLWGAAACGDWVPFTFNPPWGRDPGDGSRCQTTIFWGNSTGTSCLTFLLVPSGNLT